MAMPQGAPYSTGNYGGGGGGYGPGPYGPPPGSYGGGGGYPPSAGYPPPGGGSYGGYGPPGGGGGSYGHQGGYDQQPLMNQPGAYDNQGGGGWPPQQPNFAGASGLKQMPTTTSMNLVFFAAACFVMIASFISIICLFMGFQLVDCLEMCYHLMFGGILAVLDTPFFKSIKAMGDLKMYIGKYINLLTRVTGKGITYLFLGCSLFSSMWVNLEAPFLKFLAVVLCFFPTVVGFAAIVIGIMKSQKLNKARQKLIEMGTVDMMFDQMAQTYQGAFLSPAEFNALTMNHGGFKWEDADLKLIFNALVSNPSWRINSNNQGSGGVDPKMPKEDFKNWVLGGTVML